MVTRPSGAAATTASDVSVQLPASGGLTVAPGHADLAASARPVHHDDRSADGLRELVGEDTREDVDVPSRRIAGDHAHRRTALAHRIACRDEERNP